MSKISKPEEDAINVAAPAGFDAQSVPVESVCINQQKVSVRLLDPHQLKERLLSPPAWQTEITDENRHVIAAGIIAKRQDAGKVTRAAVFIPFLAIWLCSIFLRICEFADNSSGLKAFISFLI